MIARLAVAPSRSGGRDVPRRKPRTAFVRRPERIDANILAGLIATLPEEGMPADFPNDDRPVVVLATWVDVPGDNEGRREHRMVAQARRDTVARDFQACLDCQPHPGVLEPLPRVHIIAFVAKRGDKSNRGGRYKVHQDLLQVASSHTSVYGRGTLNPRLVQHRTGLAGLIKSDRDLEPTYAEIVTKAGEDGYARRQVVILVWPEVAA